MWGKFYGMLNGFVMVETGSLWYSVGMLKHVVQLYCMLPYSLVVLSFIWE